VLSPIVADQEMRVSFVYWEGAVQITGSSQGAAVAGAGYVEMTGYTTSIAGQF
jgi:predicted secreted hydrolase